MTKLLLWTVLFLLCWPLALVLLVLYPLFWLAGVPVRAVVSVLAAVADLLLAMLLFPLRLLARALR